MLIQNRGPVLEQGLHITWPKENPQVLADSRVSFMQHDFFDVSPVKDADPYGLRISYQSLWVIIALAFPIHSHLTVPS